MPFKIFKGIYENLGNFDDSNLFDKKIYLENNYSKAKNLTNTKIFSNEYPIIKYLSILTSLNRNKVLDFGGGFFNTYIKFKNSNICNSKIIFDNFECEEVHKYIKKKNLFSHIKKIKKTDRLRVLSNIKKLDRKYDILHFGSVIEYIDDLQSCLNSIFQYTTKPEFISFSDVYLSYLDENFYTISNYYGIEHKYLIRSKKKFEKILKKNNYKIINIEKLILPVKGEYKFYDMSNLPKKYRINYTFNYLLKKND